MCECVYMWGPVLAYVRVCIFMSEYVSVYVCAHVCLGARAYVGPCMYI